LMFVKAHRLPNISGGLAYPKDLPAFLVQEPCVHQVFDGVAWDEVGIELNQRGGPKLFSAIFRVNKSRDVFSLDLAEAPGESLIVFNKTLTKLKDIHRFALCDDAASASQCLTSMCYSDEILRCF